MSCGGPKITIHEGRCNKITLHDKKPIVIRLGTRGVSGRDGNAADLTEINQRLDDLENKNFVNTLNTDW